VSMQSVNPTTEDIVQTFDEFSDSQVDSVLQSAHDAQRSWRETSFGERSSRLQTVARVLRAQKERLATMATSEMGKPIVEAEAEIEKCAWNCDFYAEHAVRFLADEHVETNASESYVAFEPLGVVLAIMPWNYPFWQVVRFAAPALMAGNGAILKHASNVPRCAMAIQELFETAGLPKGLFGTVLVPGSGVEKLIADPRIQAVTLTGSSEVGERVASTAGRYLKKQVLELGGSDPFIVLADADLDAAATVGVRARNQNNGQSCIAAKRFIVEEAVADEFTAKFAAAVAALHVGDPMQRETNVGPLARGDLRDTLADQVERSVSSGAHAVTGGAAVAGKGYFYSPTVLDGVKADMPAFREETFGPVAAIIRANGHDDVIRLANDTEYGLGAAMFTRDTELGKQLARRIEAGNVFINGMVASDPRLPFGGVKRSGYGRELSSFGIREFVNIQTVVVTQPAPAPGPSAE
jgi:succinate-semialdehyde dehydrogenase / glutarate-semialdehyde dehydrogenase